MTSHETSHISIIIPTLNEEKFLGRVLSSLQVYPGIEIIVADGGSGDQTLDIARSFQVRIVQSTAGRGQQQNAGASHASRPILLFLHCDSKLPDDFPSLVHDIIHLPDTAAGAFRLQIDDQSFRYRLIEWGANVRSRFLEMPYGDQALFMKKNTFAEVGGFRDQPFLEDLELVQRLKRVGKIRLADGNVTTSARRWKRQGVIRTTMINQCILLGYICGIDAAKLGRMYYGLVAGKNKTNKKC